MSIEHRNDGGRPRTSMVAAGWRVGVAPQIVLLAVAFVAGSHALGALAPLICIVYDILIGWAPDWMIFAAILSACATFGHAAFYRRWATVLPLTLYISVAAVLLGIGINRLPQDVVKWLGLGFPVICFASALGPIFRFALNRARSV